MISFLNGLLGLIGLLISGSFVISDWLDHNYMSEDRAYKLHDSITNIGWWICLIYFLVEFYAMVVGTMTGEIVYLVLVSPPYLVLAANWLSYQHANSIIESRHPKPLRSTNTDDEKENRGYGGEG